MLHKIDGTPVPFFLYSSECSSEQSVSLAGQSRQGESYCARSISSARFFYCSRRTKNDNEIEEVPCESAPSLEVRDTACDICNKCFLLS